MFTTMAARIAAQTQSDLFPEEPGEFELTAPVKPVTWQGHAGPMGRNTRWTHPAMPGVEVRHCGHPTALRPYYVTGLESLHGDTFQRLTDAQQAAVRATQGEKDAGL